MTALWFAPNPARCRDAITRTSGKRSRTASAEPSSDALSSTTISASAPERDSRQARRSSLLFVLTIETLTSGTSAAASNALTREAACNERVARRVHRIRRLLSLEPGEQLLHAGLEGDLRAETEQLVGQSGVRIAVTNVAGAVLAHDLGHDLLAEPLRDHAGDLADGRRPTGADVERAAVRAIPIERERAGTSDVANVDEVTGLPPVLEHARRPV